MSRSQGPGFNSRQRSPSRSDFQLLRVTRYGNKPTILTTNCDHSSVGISCTLLHLTSLRVQSTDTRQRPPTFARGLLLPLFLLPHACLTGFQCISEETQDKTTCLLLVIRGFRIKETLTCNSLDVQICQGININDDIPPPVPHRSCLAISIWGCQYRCKMCGVHSIYLSCLECW